MKRQINLRVHGRGKLIYEFMDLLQCATHGSRNECLLIFLTQRHPIAMSKVVFPEDKGTDKSKWHWAWRFVREALLKQVVEHASWHYQFLLLLSKKRFFMFRTQFWFRIDIFGFIVHGRMHLAIILQRFSFFFLLFSPFSFLGAVSALLSFWFVSTPCADLAYYPRSAV